MKYIKPKILISKCIEFDNCRFNGQQISSEFVKKLKKHVEFKTICPELEIGLGVPRKAIRIVEKNDKKFLIQTETKKDVTKEMKTFSKNFLKNLEIDGAILKSKSPSCGIKNVKIYPSEKKSAPIKREQGFFGQAVTEKYTMYPIESEDRLRNHIIKEHFLRKIFTLASFRNIKNKKTINPLIEFHTKNKFLIMSYSQKQLKKLGTITANKENKKIQKIFEEYENHLKKALSNSPHCTSNINVLNHTFGYVSKKLKSEEKKLYFFRITSDLIPFASHPICKFKWQKYFKNKFEKIGEIIKSNNIRISMHPDQFIVLNSKKNHVVQRSIKELYYHAEVLDLMKLDKTAKIQLHIGGAYENKKESLQRFSKKYKKLDQKIKNRLVIENDDRIFSFKDCMFLFDKITIPVLFDVFHHNILNNDESTKYCLEKQNKTWKKTDGKPMVDYSSQKPETRKGSHAETIKTKDFKKFLEKSKPHDFDIMLEIKDKEKSAIKAVKIAEKDKRFIC